MARIDFVPALNEHALELAPDMREDDVAEVRAVGQTPIQALSYSIGRSDYASTFLIDGKVAAMCGVATLPVRSLLDGKRGVPWLLTGHIIDRHPKSFVVASRRAIAEMLEHYLELTQMVDARHVRALRWAQAVGFELGEVQPWGLRRESFIPITLRRAPWAASSRA